MSSNADIVILGSGSTAFAAALRASSRGARVLMIEKSNPGGTCINWGCVPSKILIHSAQLYQGARKGARIGLGNVAEMIDAPALAAHKEEVVSYLRQSRYLDVLRENDRIELVKGTARFVGPLELEFADRRIRADRILIAVGGYPRVPSIPGLEETGYLTSFSALVSKELPGSLLIVGGGVIAVELGQMYRRLGAAVTILEHGPRLLPQVESDPALAIQSVLQEEGVVVELNTRVCSVARRGGQVLASVESGGIRRELTAQKILVAVGTAPATGGLGLGVAGVETTSNGFIIVDGQMRTSAPGIWAAGDVTGGIMIATVGAREGIVAVDNMLEAGCSCRMDYLSVPMAIFTDPEVGMVGYSEAAARDAGYDVMVHNLPVMAIPKAHVTGETAGCIKMVADRLSRRILGVHLTCHRGAELINEAALAVRFRLTIDDLANTLHVYPSIGEGLRLCAQGFDRDMSRLSCCAE